MGSAACLESRSEALLAQRDLGGVEVSVASPAFCSPCDSVAVGAFGITEMSPFTAGLDWPHFSVRQWKKRKSCLKLAHQHLGILFFFLQTCQTFTVPFTYIKPP